MQTRKAFTMVELVFVIVVIGILSAVAIPKLAVNRDDAEITVGKTTLASVRNAIATERQKRILRSDFTAIGDLGNNTNAFDKFDGGASEVLMYPVKNCGTSETGCWERASATSYKYHFPMGGTADFVLQNNRLDCTTADTTDCSRLTD
jgi:general secretion pathway protein G